MHASISLITIVLTSLNFPLCFIQYATSRRNEKIFENSIQSSYVLKGSFSDQQQTEAAQYRSLSVDIPIPPTPTDEIDVTEEAWFENEREGSLDQATLSMIQRQLFGQHGYKPENHDMISHGRSEDIPISNETTLTSQHDKCEISTNNETFTSEGKGLTLDPPATPLSVSASTVNNDLDSPLPFQLDLTPDRTKKTEEIPQSIQTDPNNDSKEPFTVEPKHNSLVPGLASPSLMTPPHRTKHKNHFLVQAGLLPETKSKLGSNLSPINCHLSAIIIHFADVHNSPAADLNNNEQVCSFHVQYFI